MTPTLSRSPTHVLALVAGLLVAVVGWTAAILFDRTAVALTADLHDVTDGLPAWVGAAPPLLASGGPVAAVVLVNAWLVAHRWFRRLLLTDAALVTGVALSAACGALLDAALPAPAGSIGHSLPDQVAGSSPTSPASAGLVAALVVVRPWLPDRSRPAAYGVTALMLLAPLAVVGAPPYLGLVLDVGTGMVAGAVVALVLRTPDLQPGREALIAGLADSGLDVADLWRADVDARGSQPWMGTTVDGRPVFVKALSPDQRAADLLFRAARWVRLRRTGDAPPEVSLRRAAEHEALVAHQARSLGVATPEVLGVASVGTRRVALAYEGVAGRSIDAVDPAEVTDDVVRGAWQQVQVLRRNGIAHRDLRLANVFLADDGRVLLIDFGFAELAASPQLRDTDLAELLAATSTLVGAERATRLACECLGVEALERARDWLHPLVLSRATRRAVDVDGGLERLRAAVDECTGHTVSDYQPLGRLSPAHVLGAVFGAVGVYSLLALAAHEGIARRMADVDGLLLVGAVLLGLLVPVVDALAYRSATGRRVALRTLCTAAFASATPVASPTPWSFANRVLSDAARDAGVQVVTAKRAASDRCAVVLASAPVLVAGFAAAGLRTSYLSLGGIGLGVAAGAGVLLVEVLVLVATPGGRELGRVWLRPFRTHGLLTTSLVATAAWSALAVVLQGTTFALAARAAGVGTGMELLVALGIAASALASLLPVPGGVGVVEVLTGVGLLPGNGVSLAVLGAVLGRVALFWVPLPASLWAYRSTRHYRSRLRRTEPVLPTGTPPTATGVRSWWT